MKPAPLRPPFPLSSSFTLPEGQSSSGSINTVVNIPSSSLTSDIDVFFLADTTGSTGDLIASLETAFSTVAAQLKSALPNANIEFGAAQFKDYYDGPPFSTVGISVDQPLTSSVSAVQTAIGNWVAEGGGDIPEEISPPSKTWAKTGSATAAGPTHKNSHLRFRHVRLGKRRQRFPLSHPRLHDFGVGEFRRAHLRCWITTAPARAWTSPAFGAVPGGPADGRDQGSTVANSTGGQILYNIDFTNPQLITDTIETALLDVTNISLTVNGDPGTWQISIPTSPVIGEFTSADSPVSESFGISVIAPTVLDTRNLTVTLSANGQTLDTAPLTLNSVLSAPPQLVVVSQPFTGVAGTTFNPAFVVDVEDPFGNVLNGFDGAVTMTTGTGPTASPAGTTTVTSVDGVATFSNVKMDTAGKFTFNFSGTNFSTGMSNTVTVSPSTPFKVAFAQVPSTATAGVAMSSPAVVVDVEDQFGNVCNVKDMVKFWMTTSPTKAGLHGTRLVRSVGGVATFTTLYLTKAGTYTFLASVDGLGLAESGAITVNPGPRYKLIFLHQPSNSPAGAAIGAPPVVELIDRYGNIDTVDTSSVTLSILSGPAGSSLGGTNIVGVSNALATFSNVTIDTPGHYRLEADDSGLIVKSRVFTITA